MSDEAPELSRGSQLLAATLARKGISKEELEARLGVAAGTVSRWASGKRRPTLKWATELRKVLGISASSWLAPPTADASCPVGE